MNKGLIQKTLCFFPAQYLFSGYSKIFRRIFPIMLNYNSMNATHEELLSEIRILRDEVASLISNGT